MRLSPCSWLGVSSGSWWRLLALSSLATMIKVIAFSTNEYYQRLSMRLEASLSKYGIPYEFRRFEHPGSWHKAVSMKPQFIRDMLAETSLEGVLYLDADAEVHAPLPLEILDGVDIAWTNFQRSPNHPNECLTGTMFFRKSDEVLRLIDAWIERLSIWAHSSTPEQDAFKQMFLDLKPSVMCMDLGPSWTYIYDDFQQLFPNVRPFIVHYQASRDYRAREIRDEKAKAKEVR